jgi:hypothetical protein
MVVTIPQHGLSQVADLDQWQQHVPAEPQFRRPTTSRLSTNVAPSTVRAGSTIAVRGRLTRADWDKPRNPQTAYARQRVYLQRATSTSGTYHTLKSVITDRHGYAHTSVKTLSGTRCYRFVSHTNSTTQRKVARADCIRAH